MGVQNSIDRLNTIKARIRTNLAAQGITVPEDSVLSEMAEQILSVAGEDGVSATHSWNGTVLTVTSASGTSSADLKGEKGDTGPAGYTPQKGTDYFTDEDKQELVTEVLAALPAAEGVDF